MTSNELFILLVVSCISKAEFFSNDKKNQQIKENNEKQKEES